MKGDKTTVLALIAAVVILSIVGIKSFFDYQVAKLGKTQAGNASALEESQPNPAGIAPPLPNASTPQNNLAVAEPTEEDFQRSLEQMPRSVLPPVPATLLETPKDTPPPAPGSGEKNPQPQAELETLRKENALFQDKLNRLRSGSDATSGPVPALTASSTTPGSALTAVGENGGIDPLSDTPDSPSGASTGAVPASPEPGPPAFGPTGATPTAARAGDRGEGKASSTSDEAEIAALADQVKRQPAIAKVLAYDPQWAVLVLSGGSENNIKTEMRFAIRRGTEILGFIKVTEVEPNQSIAELMSPNKYSPTARKPRRGDDVIAFNLF